MERGICPYCKKDIKFYAYAEWCVNDSIANHLECPFCSKSMLVETELQPIFWTHPITQGETLCPEVVNE
jgi:C4-type Zn-finger protein